MQFEIIGRSVLALGLACGATMGCGSDTGAWVDAILDARDKHDGHHHGGGADPGDPECPDICGAICAGEPEPETPPGCPIPGCACD